MKIWLWDIPLLFVLGIVYARIQARWFAEKHPDFYYHAGMITNALFWLNAIACALGAWPWFGVEHVYIVPKGIGLFYVLSYPLWFVYGGMISFALFGRRPTQGGFLWPFTVKEKTKPFAAPWK